MVKHYTNFNIQKIHKGSIILIGNFDGVHLGHQKLFQLAQSYKKKYNLKIGVVNFDPMPKMFFNKKLKNFRLSNIDQKIELLSNFKVDFGISIDTDQAFLIVPKETLGNLRISYSPHLIIPGISRLIISLDNSTIYPTKIYAGQHYISMVSLNNKGILWKYLVE